MTTAIVSGNPTAIVSGNQAALAVLSQSIDLVIGYPRPGVDVGGGIHVPAAQSRTTSAAGAPLPHPTLAQWALRYDPSMAAALASVRAAAQARINAATPLPNDAAIVALPAPASLAADWFA